MAKATIVWKARMVMSDFAWKSKTHWQGIAASMNVDAESLYGFWPMIMVHAGSNLG